MTTFIQAASSVMLRKPDAELAAYINVIIQLATSSYLSPVGSLEISSPSSWRSPADNPLCGLNIAIWTLHCYPGGSNWRRPATRRQLGERLGDCCCALLRCASACITRFVQPSASGRIRAHPGASGRIRAHIMSGRILTDFRSDGFQSYRVIL
jgi:hypothetical protein